MRFPRLLTLPLAGGLLYVQPVYVRSAGTNSYPLLQKVLVAFGEKIGFADDLDSALDQVFGSSGTTGTGTGTGTTPPPTGTGTTGTGPAAAAQARLQSALQDAATALKDSSAALKAGDFAAYGDAQRRLSTAVQAAVDAEQELASASAPKPSASASTAVTTPKPSASK